MTSTRQHTRRDGYNLAVLSGGSAAVRRLRLQVGRIAPHFRSTLLVGEAGAGKYAVAEELHRLSPGNEEDFRQMSVQEALRQMATPGVSGGMVYLPGLQELKPALQEELSRGLKCMERRWRVVLASECEPRGMVAAGRMSETLCAALAIPMLRLVPLRDRVGDVDELAAAMLRSAGAGASFAPDALLALRGHDWPGNLEELWRVCAEVAQRVPPGAVVGACELPLLGDGRAETLRLDEVVERHVKDVLQRCAGNKLKAAELLGISRSTLYRMLEV